MLELLFLLLPVAAGYGWIMGRNSVRQAQRKQSRLLSRHYYKGLNFLFSDQPDKAVDTLIKMITLDSNTAETHVAMGNFFRHRGELDRAIRIHQNLVEKDQIGDELKQLALKELGKDYLMAGFLERAEGVYLQLLHSDKHYDEAQRQLFNVYQITKDWHKAIELAEKLGAADGASGELSTKLSHYYCEVAQTQLRNGNRDQAQAAYARALAIAPHSVRARLSLAEIALAENEHRIAFDILKAVPQTNSGWLPEAIPMLLQSADALNAQRELEEVLDAHGQDCTSAFLTRLALKHRDGVASESIIEEVQQHLHKHPTVKGYDALLSHYIEREQDDSLFKQSLLELHQLMEKQIVQRPKYRCINCGFSGQSIHWLCPSCKKWDTNLPIKGIDGE